MAGNATSDALQTWEILNSIVSYLDPENIEDGDLSTLAICARVSRHFNDHAVERLWSSSSSAYGYWAEGGSHLPDLISFGPIDPEYIKKCARNIRTLRLGASIGARQVPDALRPSNDWQIDKEMWKAKYHEVFDNLDFPRLRTLVIASSTPVDCLWTLNNLPMKFFQPNLTTLILKLRRVRGETVEWILSQISTMRQLQTLVLKLLDAEHFPMQQLAETITTCKELQEICVNLKLTFRESTEAFPILQSMILHPSLRVIHDFPLSVWMVDAVPDCYEIRSDQVYESISVWLYGVSIDVPWPQLAAILRARNLVITGLSTNLRALRQLLEGLGDVVTLIMQIDLIIEEDEPPVSLAEVLAEFEVIQSLTDLHVELVLVDSCMAFEEHLKLDHLSHPQRGSSSPRWPQLQRIHVKLSWWQRNWISFTCVWVKEDDDWIALDDESITAIEPLKRSFNPRLYDLEIEDPDPPSP